MLPTTGTTRAKWGTDMVICGSYNCDTGTYQALLAKITSHFLFQGPWDAGFSIHLYSPTQIGSRTLSFPVLYHITCLMPHNSASAGRKHTCQRPVYSPARRMACSVIHRGVLGSGLPSPTFPTVRYIIDAGRHSQPLPFFHAC